MRSIGPVSTFAGRPGGGGYLTLQFENACTPYLCMLIGSPKADKLLEYERNSREQAARLRAHPKHLLSLQSRNPETSQWTGAIRLRRAGVILSFAGLPELVNQAYCFALASKMGWLSSYDAVLCAIAMAGTEKAAGLNVLVHGIVMKASLKRDKDL